MSDPRVDTMAIERKYGLHAPAEKVTRRIHAVRDSAQLSNAESACACVPYLAPATVVDAASQALCRSVMGTTDLMGTPKSLASCVLPQPPPHLHLYGRCGVSPQCGSPRQRTSSWSHWTMLDQQVRVQEYALLS